ncbi:hypothetical protein [Chitinophaga filiformis]|uniref:Phage derived protein Gp49-like n=1 Tax=Chitinophaga filiformis TaxID=104663 RepID=A0ABY4I254_CHIFI|nr:hypothetical protein [Chitinophaga filiformis]UPK69703.1 hypothetical protein MYF79_00180 [Chitinophaga filiformis]
MTKQNSSIFELRQIEAIKSRQHKFYDLSINGVFQLAEFESNLENKYQAELRTLLSIMDHCSNGGTLPKEKMRDITPRKQTVKEYEFKSKNLRIYAIQQPGSKVVIFCGYKNSQDSDISQFRHLKRNFLDNLK